MHLRVVVTGLGSVTPLGVGYHTLWRRLLAGDSGITTLRHDKYSDIPSRVAGQVPRGSKAHAAWDANEWLTTGEQSRMALFTQYAFAAAQEAIEDAGVANLSEEERESVGVNIGSGIGSLDDIARTSLDYQTSGYRKVSPLFIPRFLVNLAAGHISIRHSFRGPSLSPSTACTTGAHAIGDAYHMLRNARPSTSLLSDSAIAPPRIMIAGASEASITPLALAGFGRARALSTRFNTSPHIASRPFDSQRDGFVMAEGAAVLVLEELEHALSRRPTPTIYAEVIGYGSSSDAHHITAPRADGRGPYLSMRRALADAQIEVGQVSRKVQYVNAHATGTPLGDLAENRAIRQLMVEEAGIAPQEVNVSSVKGALGHLLGASGAVEALCSVLSVREDVIPPTINLDKVGDGDENEKNKKKNNNNNNANEWDMNYVPLTKQNRQVDIALSNSFGFGGTCASLCFKKFVE